MSKNPNLKRNQPLELQEATEGKEYTFAKQGNSLQVPLVK